MKQDRTDRNRTDREGTDRDRTERNRTEKEPGAAFPYDDILHTDYEEFRKRNTRRRRMSMTERAAQFAPFAALTGYGDAVEETSREHTERMDRRE